MSTLRSFAIALALSLALPCIADTTHEEAAYEVLSRSIGSDAQKFILRYSGDDKLDHYRIDVVNNKVLVEGNSATALTHGAYDYLKNATHSIISWSGSNINVPDTLPPYRQSVQTPFKYRYYFNTVTHGYTTPYWDWPRWEQEIDWMAMHGMNMPLIGGAHEAILYRVFKKLGLSHEESIAYFTGPAHFPWNRMGNIRGWDGPLPLSFLDKQLALSHQILKRMKELEMHPIVHAFAGFVPSAISRLYPEEELRELGWGGFDEKMQILPPDSKLFLKIGKLYIEEWEKEFGEGEFYLADSFNEMEVPISDAPKKALLELADYGRAVYRPIAEASPDAVWVMQGWTFPYHLDRQGRLFWSPQRLQALMSKVPDDKLLILDMANEYNAIHWKRDYSWDLYQGFFGKQWIYSFIPNMGGKVPLNGVLDFYAEAPAEAINFEHKKNMVGFGFAPEGIENNEIIYELLTDWGWRDSPIDLDSWVNSYCLSRYNSCPDSLIASYDLLRISALGTFTDHPRYLHQFRPGEGKATVHKSEQFEQAVTLFLVDWERLKNQPLYVFDAIELGAQLISLKIDERIAAGDSTFTLFGFNKKRQYENYQHAIDLMLKLDRLLASHPNHQLRNWVDLARAKGDNEAEKLYYESNAKRLVTTWGGDVNDYSTRSWSGLTGSYYAQRWQLWLDAQQSGENFDIKAWEESWIKRKWKNTTVPYADPIGELNKLITELEE